MIKLIILILLICALIPTMWMGVKTDEVRFFFVALVLALFIFKTFGEIMDPELPEKD